MSKKKLLVIILSIALALAVVLAVVLNSCEKETPGNGETTQQTTDETVDNTTEQTADDPTTEMPEETETYQNVDINDLVSGNQDETEGVGTTEEDGGNAYVAPTAATEEGDIRIPLGDLGN